MARSGPTTLALPPFEGATRNLVVWNLAAFFALAILGLISRNLLGALTLHLQLSPWFAVHGQIWQLVTYAFLPMGLVSTLFALLTLWFCGSMLEGSFGSRWLYELYFVSVVGGAAIGSALSFTGLFHLSPFSLAVGPYAGILGMLLAIGKFFGDTEFLFFFVLRIKAKYMVAIYILIAIATLLTQDGAFAAAVQLSGAIAGYFFLRLAPRRGLASGVTERLYSLRNEYYRAKRRRAAKKFEVYMRGQNREVHFDKNGRYVDPDQRDPKDKSWMN